MANPVSVVIAQVCDTHVRCVISEDYMDIWQWHISRTQTLSFLDTISYSHTLGPTFCEDLIPWSTQVETGESLWIKDPWLPELGWHLEPVTHIIKAVAQVRCVHRHKYGLVAHSLSPLHKLLGDLTVLVDVQLQPANRLGTSFCHFFNWGGGPGTQHHASPQWPAGWGRKEKIKTSLAFSLLQSSSCGSWDKDSYNGNSEIKSCIFKKLETCFPFHTLNRY